MSQELANLTESIEILRKLRVQAVHIDVAFEKLFNAGKYLQKQVTSHFAE
jgi:hypothetical protein